MLNRVLIITSSSSDAETLQEIIPNARDGPFDVKWVQRLDQASALLKSGSIDVALLDFFLPDSDGIETFDALFASAPSVPIMVLVSDVDTELAHEAVQRGAQGYLLKENFQHALVPQALRSIIQRKLVEDALFVEKERALVTLNSISDAIISTDRNGSITYINSAAAQLTGWSVEEVTGRPIDDVLHVIETSTRKQINTPFREVIGQKKPMPLRPNCLLLRRDNEEIAIEDSAAPIFDRRDEIIGVVFVFRKIGPAQALMATEMAYLAQHDQLTDLPNRILLTNQLGHMIALAKRYSVSLSVLFLNLDGFKQINDSLGHSVGDQLLQSVANSLRTCIRGSDTVSRYGGDEFVVVLMEEQNREYALHTAKKILDALASPHVTPLRVLHTTASIGIAVYPIDGADAETLVKHADVAMYHAKKLGGNGCQFFDSEMNRRAVERHVIEADLRHALENQQLVLHYQPKINLRSGAIVGFEALIRWQHPQRGLIFPDEFISIAEECGLIVPIGRWVMREACRQAQAWKEAGLKIISMAVNVSALEFQSPSYLPNVRMILDETGFSPKCLELEITESILMSHLPDSSDALHTLKEMGLKLAIDDFGTGYSSLSYLQKFPIDALKIDQSFVRGIPDAMGDRIIVTSVVGMARNLMYRVIAEGVETQEQCAFLHAHQCEEGQGYYFSPPLDSDRCAKLLVSGIQL